MIHVGVDLHQRFCYMTAVDSRGRLLGAGQVRNQDQALRSYFAQFRGPVQAAVEACSFWPAFRKAVCARVQVRLVHPQRVKAIASAKLKNDRIDSATLAHLLRCDLLPAAWMADEATRELRQQVRMRATLVRQRTRLKNQVHAILHQQGLQFEGSDLFGQGGRAWLKQVSLPAAGGSAVKVYLKLIDEFTAQISTQDEELKRQWKKDKRALANYAGLVPWLRESADKRHSGGITRVGSPWLRWIMVEAAHVAVRTSPPVKKWFERLCRRKHKNAALVAVARKLLVAVRAMLHDGVGFEEKHFALN